MTPISYLRQQGEAVRSDDSSREVMADRLGITVERLNSLLAASALRPGIEWRL